MSIGTGLSLVSRPPRWGRSPLPRDGCPRPGVAVGWRGQCEERRELPRAWLVPEGSGGSTEPLSPAGMTPGEMEMRKGKTLGKGEE